MTDATAVVRTISADKASCVLHREHHPAALELEFHHEIFKYLQAQAFGITEAQLEHDPRFVKRTRIVCGTGHANVHVIAKWILSGQPLGKGAFHRAEQDMAIVAVTWFRQNGPKPT